MRSPLGTSQTVTVRALGCVGTALVCAGSAGAAPRSHEAFPGMNGRIAYLTGNRITVVSQDGQAKGRLPPVIDASRVAWSPNGRRLLISFRTIYVTDATARRLHRLPIKHTWRAGRPDAAWSPNAREIVFAADAGPRGCRSLFTYRLSSKQSTRLTSGCSANFPVWSPDGKSIAYNVDAANRLICIWTIRTRSRRCIATGFDPSWAPDGKSLAYSDGRNIRLLELRTKASTILGATTADPYESVRAPAWSPDGTAVAFIRYERSAKYDTHLYVMNIDGSNLRLIGGSVYDDRPDWQPAVPRR
jgi:Tol biopolymer transport system component